MSSGRLAYLNITEAKGELSESSHHFCSVLASGEVLLEMSVLNAED